MKLLHPALLTVVIIAAASRVHADDVAVMDIKSAGEPQSHRVVLEFYSDAAPATVANFKKLARSQFYNGTAFHRVFPHQMVQGGDPQSRKESDRNKAGTGGPGYTLPPEINRHRHVPGAVAAARLPDKLNPGRVSNGSQFYIMLAPRPALDGQYTVFAGVIEGLESLDVLSEKPADTNDNPTGRIEIESIRIVPRESASKLKPNKPSALKEFFGRVF